MTGVIGESTRMTEGRNQRDVRLKLSVGKIGPRHECERNAMSPSHSSSTCSFYVANFKEVASLE